MTVIYKLSKIDHDSPPTTLNPIVPTNTVVMNRYITTLIFDTETISLY